MSPEEIGELVERAIRRAFGRFARYGTTSVRLPITPGTDQSGFLLLEWPVECDPPRKISSETLVVWVDYDVSDDPNGNGDISDLFLQFEWGDINHKVQVDLIRGVPVSLGGSRLIVRAFYPRVEKVAPLFQPTVELRISIGIGSNGSSPGISGAARRTINYGAVGQVAQSTIQPIPPWANSVLFQNPSAANPTLVFRQFLDAAGTVLIAESDLGKLNDLTIPIVNGARFAAFFNPGAAPVNARAVYLLSVGA